MGAVSKESSRITFTYISLNGLDIWLYKLKNTYLQVSTSDKYFIVYEPEWDLENQGKITIIVRAIYSEKATRRNFLTTSDIT